VFLPIYAALFFTVALLVTTAYFLMGGLPLLTLKHDTPVDAQFIRGFFNVYYKTAFVAASGASISYALAGRPAFAMGTAGVALIVLALRAKLITIMARLGEQIQTGETSAINGLRKIHSTALAINLTQLIVLVWGVTQISL
jgi:hypothetical protein